MKQLDRLVFLQGGLCFFCKEPLPAGDASVEHLLATANGGSNSEENCVACCKSLNALLGHKSLKEKLQVVLNQRGQFKCPKGTANAQLVVSSQTSQVAATPDEKLALVVADLRKQLTEAELSSLINQLQARGTIAVSDTNVTYDLPPKSV
jgi:hypothetical protein